MEEDTRNRLRRVTAAIESRDWPWAVAELRDIEYCATPRELTEDAWTALVIAEGAWLAPSQVLIELQILLYDGEDNDYLKLDAERVPTVIAEKLFAAALCRVRESEAEARWVDVCRYVELLLQLPGACDAREQVLLDLLAGLIDRANVVAAEITHQNRQSRMNERDQVEAVWGVMGLAAQSSTYDIGESLLIGLLRGAKLPILRGCGSATALLLWDELVSIWELRKKHNLSAAVEEWLHRTIFADGPDEHAATELEEP